MTATPARPTVRLHNSAVSHAGKIIGRYADGAPRYATRCNAERRGSATDAYLAGGEVTCKRCAARLAALDAAAAARA